MRAVTNATITGIDFVGSTNGTITGKVVKQDGTTGLFGATVTAKTQEGSVITRTATTRSSGTFTIRNVPVGPLVEVSVEAAGYAFDPVTVALTPGVTMTLPNFVAEGTIQPTAVVKARARYGRG